MGASYVIFVIMDIGPVSRNLQVFALKTLEAVKASSVEEFKRSQGNEHLESILDPGSFPRLVNPMRSLPIEDRQVASAMTFIRLLPVAHSAEKRARADAPDANIKWIKKKQYYEAMLEPAKIFLDRISTLDPSKSFQHLYSELIKQSSDLKEFIRQHQGLIDSVKEVLSHEKVGNYLCGLVRGCAEAIRKVESGK